jgi:hypothetical protein
VSHGDVDAGERRETGARGCSASMPAGRVQLALAAISLATVAIATWPGSSPAEVFHDTHSYLNWPAGTILQGVEIMGSRPMAYPFFLKLLGTGPALVYFQWSLSIVCWSYLGWRLARGVGVLATALLSVSPIYSIWTVAALTESISNSLLALLLALGLGIASRPTIARLCLWCGAMLPFLFIRDANFVVAPFLMLPVLASCTRRTTIAVGLAAVALAAAYADSAIEERASTYALSAFTGRVREDVEAREWFEARGMPTRLYEEKIDPESLDEFMAWLRAGGTWTYRWWALSQPRFYRETWDELAQPDRSWKLEKRYFSEATRADRVPRGVVPWVGDALHTALAPPRSLWLALLLLPAIEWRRSGRVSVPALWTTTLVIGTLATALVSYVSDAIEIPRHMLSAYILYRFATLLGLYTLYRLVRAEIRPDPQETSRP